MQFLSNPTTQFIVNSGLTVFGIVIASIIAVAIYRRQSRKEIAYVIISNSPVISVDAELQGKAQIIYNGKTISDARLFVLKVWNTGNLPIAISDYDVPVKLSFGTKAEVLDFEILETVPNNLQVAVKQSGQDLIIDPVLLNSQDSFKIKVLLTQFSNIFSVDARIVGVKQIKRAESTYIGSYLRAFFGPPLSPSSFRMVITFVVAGLFIMVFSSSRTFNLHEYIIILVSIIVATLITLIISWKIKNVIPQDVRFLFVILTLLNFLTFVPLYLIIQVLLEHPIPPF